MLKSKKKKKDKKKKVNRTVLYISDSSDDEWEDKNSIVKTKLKRKNTINTNFNNYFKNVLKKQLI